MCNSCKLARQVRLTGFSFALCETLLMKGLIKSSCRYALQRRHCAPANSGKDHLNDDEIRTVVMGTMLLQMSLEMFLTLTDEICSSNCITCMNGGFLGWLFSLVGPRFAYSQTSCFKMA